LDIAIVSNYLRTRRKIGNLTQVDVAEKMRVTPQAVSKWERGESLPDISLLTDLAKLYSVSVESILTGNEKKEISLENIGESLNAFVSEDLFALIKEDFEISEGIWDLNVTPDVFLFITNSQKMQLLDIIFTMPDYVVIIDDILPYLNNIQRQKLMHHILKCKDYDNIEPIMPYLSKAIKTEVVRKLLENDAFGFLEEIIPMLGSEHKDMLITHVLDNNYDLDILDNFYSFFDKKQRTILSELYEPEDSENE